MFLVLLLCTALIVLIVLVLRTRTKVEPSCNDPPVCCGSLPIIGITHLIATNTYKLWHNMAKVIEDTSKRGGITTSRIGFHRYYFITDPEDAATVSNVCLEKHYLYKFMECIFGQSLLTAPVSIWSRHRKLLSPAFSLPVIHGFMEIFNDQAKKLVDEMHSFAGQGPFIASKYIQNNILRTAFLTAFGGSSLHNEETFIRYLNAINEGEHLIIQRYQKPWLHSDLIVKFSGLKTKLDKIVKTMSSISSEIIQKAQAATTYQQVGNSGIDDRQVGVRSFLDAYLEMNANKALTIKEVREELEITIAAAYDTTAIQLENILILLGSYPKIQERVYNEIIQEIGQEHNVDKDDLRKLVYTDAVIKEALRILPAVPIIARTVDKNVALKNYNICSGSMVMIMLHGINRDASWGPDADQFRPERWLEPGGVPNVASAFASFSTGKRSCIGKTYALTSLKVSLAHLVRKYHVEADYTKLLYKLEIVLKPFKGNEITLKHRTITNC